MKTWLAALPLAVSGTVALAQQTSPGEDPVDEVTVYGRHLQTGDTASRLGLTPFETPASVEVLFGDVIRERGDISLVEAVTRATGITDSSSTGNGGTGLTARGFSGHGSVTQLFDGTRYYVGAGTLTFPFDTWAVERVEILHGPASVLHGEGALGGAVNVIPKRPTREAEHEARLTLAGDHTTRLGLGSGGPLGDALAYRLDVSHNRSDGWLDSNGDSSSLVIAASLLWDITPDLAVSLRHDYGDQQPARYFGVPLIDGELNREWRKRNFNVGDAHVQYRDRSTRLRWDWTPTEHIAFTNETYHLTSDRDWRNAESFRWNAETGLIDRSTFIEINHDHEQRGNRANVAFSHNPFGLRNRTSVGFDVNVIDFQHTNNAPYGGSDSVDPADFDAGFFINLAGTSPRFQTDTTQYSVFAENRLHLNERVSVVAGLRYDRMEVERADLLDSANNFSRTFSPFNWRIGTVFDVTSDLVVYAQYATQAGHLGSLITMSAAQADYSLSSSHQWEAGVKQMLWDGRGEWTLAAYNIVRKKLLTSDPEDPGVTVQVGQQSARGVEASLALDLGAGWHVHGNVAALNARYDDFTQLVGGVPVSRAGNTPNGIPQRTANVLLGCAFAPDWRASAGWRYVGSRYSDTANEASVGAYNVADAMLRWRTTDAVTLTLRGRNLFDRVYTTSSSLSQWRVAEPRTVELTADFRFR